MSAGSTTPAPVELVRRTTEAADRQDLDALMSMCAPDGVYDTTPSGLGTYAGPAAIRAFLKEWWDAFEELHATLEEVLDLGNGVTFSVIRQDARPAGSAGSVSTREAHVAEWRAGKAVRVTVYTDLEQGRAAAMRLAEERARAPDA
ncbi:MAG TPA: nuclear transport factor 2 family protein [Solirubrobacteraceae bacterium]|nr:nuclear transport factor 2 family protein [Solirubrobacteraceae bacterium]